MAIGHLGKWRLQFEVVSTTIDTGTKRTLIESLPVKIRGNLSAASPEAKRSTAGARHVNSCKALRYVNMTGS